MNLYSKGSLKLSGAPADLELFMTSGQGAESKDQEGAQDGRDYPAAKADGFCLALRHGFSYEQEAYEYSS